MSSRKPIKDGAELFQSINRSSAEAEWTVEELCQELQEGGIDPNELVKSAREKLEELRRNSGELAKVVEAEDISLHQSVLAKLHARTKLPASQIALKMGVPVPFLSAVGRYPKVVPLSWRRELDARAERNLGTNKGEVLSTFEHPYQAQMAASRDGAYDSEQLTPEKILDQSGMDEKHKRYWLTLAAEG